MRISVVFRQVRRPFVNRLQLILFRRMKILVRCFVCAPKVLHVARMSRECGELRMRIEKSDSELQRVNNATKQENGRIKCILSDIWKLLDSLPMKSSTSTGAKPQSESVSSEIARVQARLALVSECLAESGCRQGKEDGKRLKELEESVAEKEAELTKLTRDFSAKLVEMKDKLDTTTSENENLKRRSVGVLSESDASLGKQDSLRKSAVLAPPPATRQKVFLN